MNKIYTTGILTFLFINSFFLQGQNWQQISRTKSLGGTISNINSIAALKDTLYIGTNTGVWMSPSGNGGDWVQYGGIQLNSTAIAEVAIANNMKLVRTTGNLIYRLDGSNNWTGVGPTGIGSISVHQPTGYGFASKDYTGIYRSTDNGATWNLYNTTSLNENLTGSTGPIGLISSKRIWRIYPSENHILAQGKNSVHISEDNGNNWYYRWGDLIVDHDAGSNIKWVYLNKYKGKDYLFVASDGASWNGTGPNLSRSDNYGVNYQHSDFPASATITGIPYEQSYCTDFCNYGDKALFLRKGTSDIYKSNDNGLSWSSFESGLSAYSQKKLISTQNKLLLADNYSLWYYDLTVKPTWNASYPTVSNITGSTADITVQSNQSGTAYFVALPASDPAPNDTQIIDGLDANNQIVNTKGSFPIVANTTKTGTVTGMLSLTNYKIYVVVTNEIGNPAIVKNVSATTAAAYLTVSQTGNGTVSHASGNYVGNITLTATADSSYRFDKWTINGIIYTTASVSLNMITNYDAVATFTKVALVNVTYSGNGNTFPVGATYQPSGKSMFIRAYPSQGYKVAKWTVNGTNYVTSSESRSVFINDNSNNIAIVFELKTLPTPGLCDTMTIVNDMQRPDAAWETGYKSRVNELFASRIDGYNDNRSYAGSDVGKWFWSEKLAKMAYYPAKDSLYISSVMPAVSYRNVGAGSFWYPFSAPGYAMYYFRYKDSIAKYNPAQLDTIKSAFYNFDEWKYLMRKDHFLDMVYPNGKEFNSENFHWMLRSAGFLFAHEFHNENNTNNYRLNFVDADSVSRIYVNVAGYFDGYLNNLTKALYSSGRVEWNSNNYWAHTLNAMLALYEGADKCNNPDGVEAKKKAKACLDWMMMEAALHYLDGYQIAADARAKSVYLSSSPGSVEPYTYAYFTDNTSKPSYPSNFWATNEANSEVSGFLMNSSYRPPQIIIDIAQKKFTPPVEIQSAKPYYHVDFGDYWNLGEYPYNDWKGNTTRSRRFEFETMYLGENFTMSSVAGGRPDGSKGTFSEQALWEIGIKGSTSGAKQISGNAANYGYAPAGRCPYHEIGQFRNMMAHMVKLPSSNQFYILIPDPSDQLTATGSGAWHEWDGDNLYMNMGNDVYMACKAYAATSHTANTSNSLGTSNHTIVAWNFANNQIGAVIIEMGTKSQFGTFDNFKTLSKAKSIGLIASNTIEYTGASGDIIKMEYTEPTSYTMTANTHDTPSPNPFTPAGNYPKVWGNNNYIDFSTWDSYRTVFGESIVNQPWGEGKMTIKVGNQHTTIKIDTISANVTYLSKQASETPKKADFTYNAPINFENSSNIDSSYNISSIEWDFNNDLTWDGTGESITHNYGVNGNQTINIKVNTDGNCYYQAVKIVEITLTDIQQIADNVINVFPNPANANVNIETTELIENSLVYIYDLSGKEILKQPIEKTHTTIPLQNYKQGVYIMKIGNGNSTIYSNKLIIQ